MLFLIGKFVMYFVLTVVAAIVLMAALAFAIYQYIDYSQHRSTYGPPYGRYDLRFWLIVLSLVSAWVGYFSSDQTVMSVSLAVFCLLSLTIAINCVAVVVRMLVAAYCRYVARRAYNPLLRQYERGPRGVADNPLKDLLPTVARYSWAVPNPAALQLIASYAPVVEIGAGTGYWAWVLWQTGVDIIAYDASPGPTLRNKFHRFKLGWYLVHKNDGAYAVVNHQDRTLLLCWPSDNHMSDRVLRAYQGKHVIYIGANDSEHVVYTGNQAFHQELKEKWQLIEELSLPSWGALVDKVRVYERA